MEEKIKAKEIERDFQVELDKTLRQLSDIYPRVSRIKTDENLSNDAFTIVIYSILLNTLREIQLNSNKLTMREFHRKYVPNLPILFRCDFTCEEFTKIIDESYLKTRDKNIAYKFFVEKKNKNDIYAELEDIGDKKTIDSNLPKINDALLYRACIYNKEHSEK